MVSNTAIRREIKIPPMNTSLSNPSANRLITRPSVQARRMTTAECNKSDLEVTIARSVSKPVANIDPPMIARTVLIPNVLLAERWERFIPNSGLNMNITPLIRINRPMRATTILNIGFMIRQQMLVIQARLESSLYLQH